MENWMHSERLCVTITETDRLDHLSLADKLMQAAHRQGMAGATVFRGYQSYGPRAHFHASHVLDLSNDLPLLVIIVDKEEKIRELIPVIEELLLRADCGALLTLESLQSRQLVRKP